MSGLNKNEVMLAVTGALSTAPVGTKPSFAIDPVTGLFTALSTPWFNRGFVGEDGLTEDNTVSRDEKRAWQRRTVLRRVTTESASTFTFRLVQVNRENILLVRGTTLNSDGTITVDPGVEHKALSWTMDIEDELRAIRKWLPSAAISEIASVTYSNDELIGWEITLSCDEWDFEDGTHGTFKEKYNDIPYEEPEPEV